MLINLQKENRNHQVTEDAKESRHHLGKGDGLNLEIEDDLNLEIEGRSSCTREGPQKTECFQCLEIEPKCRLRKDENVGRHRHHEIEQNDRRRGTESEGGQVHRRETETDVVLEVGDVPNHVPEIVVLLPGVEEDVQGVYTNPLEDGLFPATVIRSIEDQLRNLA